MKKQILKNITAIYGTALMTLCLFSACKTLNKHTATSSQTQFTQSTVTNTVGVADEQEKISSISFSSVESFSSETISPSEPASSVTSQEEPESRPESEPKPKPGPSTPTGVVSEIKPLNACFVRGECISDKQWQFAVGHWNSIRADIRNRFENDGWTCIITNGDIDGKGIWDIAGLTCFDKKHCYVRVYSNPRNNFLYDLLHELGHYMSSLFDYCAHYDSEWKDIYAAESNTWTMIVDGGDNYGSTNASEYWAESWACYYLDPESLNDAPLTKNILKTR